ncbi:MAG: SpoIIE family protein phosphatase [Methanomicrobiales archaeon]|nr:SpoIIE family protein phosphatase [Methanomicrobiales archaeon]MDD1654963.1 SpoIIE family protein phosphatase [Methanomicrobiales archaeon]
MAGTIITSLILLLQLACVITVVAYLVTRARFFDEVLDGHLTVRTQAILILVFGALSIYGTAGGFTIQGAIINIRDLGPMVGGLVGGPVVGVGAGLIGAAYRGSLGGFTVVPCTIATVLAGLLAGLIWLANNRRFPGLIVAVTFAALMEGFHMLLTLALARPFDQAVALVSSVAIPMILGNAAGMFIFALIIRNRETEQRVQSERDTLLREVERKNTELAIAAEIQQSFLPDTITQLEHFDIAAKSVMAKEVGGDFFDVIPFEVIHVAKDRLGLLIADVSGKGIPAALFMALSRIVVRVNATWFQQQPAEAIRQANAIITADSKAGMFVTLFYGILNGHDRSLTYVNAGHNPPLVCHGADGTFSDLPATGMAVGADPGAEYTSSRIVFGPGDVMVLYTDGITEAENTACEMYGEDRLRGVVALSRGLPAAGIVSAILDSVQGFTGTTPQSDDITLMVVRSV